MQEQESTTVEVNGIKYEVDLRGAKKIQQFKVGDRVKVLIKGYGTDYTVHAGVIVGIDAFKALPTVVVAYMPTNAWTDPSVQFAYLNAQTKDTEIVPMAGDEIIPTRDTILSMFGRALDRKRVEIAEIEAKREYFLRRFGSSIGVAMSELATPATPE